MNREKFLQASTRVAQPVIIDFKGNKYPNVDQKAVAELSFEEETIEITLFSKSCDQEKISKEEIFIWTYADIERVKFFNLVENFEETNEGTELSEALGLKLLFKSGVTYLLSCKDANIRPELSEFLPRRGVEVASDLA
ncbi:hypothetical protein OZX68_00460 [Streptococcaceae bacterium ESL0729]|nr:hypothetical protein OZX68_00460 [Streptococcaceae bacterium ESL0729]